MITSFTHWPHDDLVALAIADHLLEVGSGLDELALAGEACVLGSVVR